MVTGITYSDENMTKSADLCENSMERNGFDCTFLLSPANISDEFKNINKDIFTGVRGAGCYWLFKPYIINSHIQMMDDGDILIYSDAGVEWIDSAKHIVDVMDQDLFLFTSGHLHHEYCKKDVMNAILGSGGSYRRPEQQVHAAVIFIRVNDYTRRFVKEWLLWCQMPGLIDDSPSILPNHPDFKDHRHDQSIISCMAIRDGLKLHYWPDKLWFSTQRHRWPEDQYPLLFLHHRKRNEEWQL